MQEWGKRTDGLTIYQLAEHVIVDTDGNLYYSNELLKVLLSWNFPVILTFYPQRLPTIANPILSIKKT